MLAAWHPFFPSAPQHSIGDEAASLWQKMLTPRSVLCCLCSVLQAKEKAAVAGGKAPFFLSKAEKMKRELLAKYEELKSGGRLDKFMEKRRKKNAAKDHRYLPSGRRAGGME
jgi:hypothetical protein